MGALKLRDEMTAPLKTATAAAGNNFGMVGGGLLAGPIGIAAALGSALIAFGTVAIQKTTDAGQDAYQLGQKFGLGGEQASEWMTIARHLGVNTDSLGMGFKFLSVNAENMNLSMKEHGKLPAGLAQPYTDLGVNVFDSAGHLKDSNELMLESADAFKAMPDGLAKTGLALKLFGRSGMDMLPVLNQGRQALEDMMKSGKLTGEVMSGPQVEAAHKMFLAQQKLSSEMAGFWTMIGTTVMPIAAEFMAFITEKAVPELIALANPTKALAQSSGIVGLYLPKLLGFLELLARTTGIGLIVAIVQLNSRMDSTATAGDRITGSVDVVIEAFGGGPGALAGFSGLITRMVTTIQTGTIPIFGDLATLWRDVLQPALGQVTARLPELMEHMATMYQKVRPVIAVILELVNVALQGLIVVLKVVVPPAINLLVGMWETTMTVIGVVADTFMALWKVFDDLFHGRWGKLWGDVVNLFATAVGGIFSIVGSLVNAVTTFFGELADNIIGTKGSIPKTWTGVVGWLEGLPQNLLGEVGRLDRALYDAGISMVEGFISGIARQWSNLLAWLANHVTSLPQGIMDALGIHSESTVMAEAGKSMVGGLSSRMVADLSKMDLGTLSTTVPVGGVRSLAYNIVLAVDDRQLAVARAQVGTDGVATVNFGSGALVPA